MREAWEVTSDRLGPHFWWLLLSRGFGQSRVNRCRTQGNRPPSSRCSWPLTRTSQDHVRPTQLRFVPLAVSKGAWVVVNHLRAASESLPANVSSA